MLSTDRIRQQTAERIQQATTTVLTSEKVQHASGAARQLLRNRGKHLAVALGTAGALAGAGGGIAHAATAQPAHQAQPGHVITVKPKKKTQTGGITLTKPATIYDAVNPGSLPAGANAAVYADGAYAASPAQVAGHPSTLWIDTNTTDPHANVLDVEPGDATPAQAATWVHQKLTDNPASTAILYTMKSEWAATQDAVHALPASEQSHIKWWIADPTGTPHVVPGSDATQWYWGQNFDETSATAGF